MCPRADPITFFAINNSSIHTYRAYANCPIFDSRYTVVYRLSILFPNQISKNWIQKKNPQQFWFKTTPTSSIRIIQFYRGNTLHNHILTQSSALTDLISNSNSLLPTHFKLNVLKRKTMQQKFSYYKLLFHPLNVHLLTRLNLSASPTPPSRLILERAINSRVKHESKKNTRVLTCRRWCWCPYQEILIKTFFFSI